MSFFSSNIDRHGRILRGLASLVLILIALAAWRHAYPIPAVLLGLAALFTAFEALKGWCIARACGIKTRF